MTRINELVELSFTEICMNFRGKKMYIYLFSPLGLKQTTYYTERK